MSPQSNEELAQELKTLQNSLKLLQDLHKKESLRDKTIVRNGHLIIPPGMTGKKVGEIFSRVIPKKTNFYTLQRIQDNLGKAFIDMNKLELQNLTDNEIKDLEHSLNILNQINLKP